MQNVVVFPTLDPLQIATGSSGSSTARTGISLLGVKDGINTLFTTPEKFVHTSAITIAVYWNGRRLHLGRDYFAAESGGAGTGYDTVDLTPWASRLPTATDELVADYFII